MKPSQCKQTYSNSTHGVECLGIPCECVEVSCSFLSTSTMAIPVAIPGYGGCPQQQARCTGGSSKTVSISRSSSRTWAAGPKYSLDTVLWWGGYVLDSRISPEGEVGFAWFLCRGLPVYPQSRLYADGVFDWMTQVLVQSHDGPFFFHNCGTLRDTDLEVRYICLCPHTT